MKAILVGLCFTQSIAAQMLRPLTTSGSTQTCSKRCIDLGHVWCNVPDKMIGNCYSWEEFSEEKYLALGIGDTSECSNQLSDKQIIKYYSCPFEQRCNDQQDFVKDPSHRITLVPAWDGRIQSLAITKELTAPSLCRYQLRFPTGSTFGDQMKLNSVMSSNVLYYVSMGYKFDDNLEHLAFVSNMTLKVDYPTKVYLVV